jgi:sporulation protein YlmC with PRC-barrel domain
MELIGDILDKQVLDRHQAKIGKVDGIVLEQRPGKAPRVAAIEIGSVALARRLNGGLGRVVSGIAGGLGGDAHREPHRIGWREVRDIGVSITFDIDVKQTRIMTWQDWLRRAIVEKIPGFR